jgi:hypothetical protein
MGTLIRLVVSNPKGYGKQNAQSFDYVKHLIWV